MTRGLLPVCSRYSSRLVGLTLLNRMFQIEEFRFHRLDGPAKRDLSLTQPCSDQTNINKPRPSSKPDAIVACSMDATSARKANMQAMPRPVNDSTGHARRRNSCLPAPCSSSASLTRTRPSSPPRISRSQLSNAPPLVTTADTDARDCSSVRSQSSELRHFSLQSLSTSGLGFAQSREPR